MDINGYRFELIPQQVHIANKSWQSAWIKDFSVEDGVTYLLNPGTALYLGYTNRYANTAEPGRPDYMPPVILPTTLTGRSAFVKVSYFFRR